ncbi:LIM/homeobox protein Lhx9-like [Tetranychus urticae]|nr:LIM/homeobox protein Lhx9-like [Tetranychus urticae]
MKGSPKSEASLEQSIDLEYGENESSLDQQQPSSSSSTTVASTSTSAVYCGGCGHTIVDRYYLVFDDKHWHSWCLTCAECGCNLEKRCFVRNGLTYCKHDYHRLFVSFRSCSKCCQIIKPNQLVMKVNSQNFYHLDCFTCSQCFSVLHKNDYYVLIDGKIYCSDHYSSLVKKSTSSLSSNRESSLSCNTREPSSLPSNTREPSLSSNNREPSSLSSASPASSSSNNGNSKSKSKRVRTSFKHAQLKTMKSYFSVNQNPDAKDLKGLSTKTGLSKRVLQVWFQNARAKWRKNNPKHGDCSSTSGNSKQSKGNTSNCSTLGTGCDTNSQQSQSQLNSLNGLTSSIAPASPSTGIGSPGGSSHSRPFSTPSPSSGLTIHEPSSLLLTNSNGSSLDQFPPLTGPSPTPESPNQSLQQQQQSSSSSSEPLGLSLPPTGVGPTSVSSCSSPSISHHQHVQQHSLGPSQSPLSIPIESHLTGVVTPHQPPSLLTSSGLALHPTTSHHSALHTPLSLPIDHHSIHLHRHPEGSSMYSPFEETLLPHSTSFQPLY